MPSAPLKPRPFCSVRRFVPSLSIWATRSLSLDCVIPSTPTMAAIPMQMPSAESAARSRRMRMPRLAKAATSEALRRDASCADASTCVLLYPAVLELDAPVHRGGELVVVRDDRDGRAVAIEG